MKATSRAALEDVVSSGRQDTQVRAILRFLTDHGAHTAREVAAGVEDLDAYTVSKRRAHLVRCGLVRELPARTCAVTGRQAHPIDATSQGVEVAMGGDVPAPGPSKRDRELAVLGAARRLARPDGWTQANRVSLEEAVWAMDAEPRPRDPAVPWGHPRRWRAAQDGVWVRQDGTAVAMEEMNWHHLAGAIRWCRKHGAPDSDPVLAALLREAAKPHRAHAPTRDQGGTSR